MSNNIINAPANVQELVKKSMEGPEAFGEVLEQLKAGVDKEIKAYNSVARDFVESFNQELENTAASLEKLEGEIAEVSAAIEKAKAALPAIVVSADLEKLEAAESEITELEAKKAQLVGRRDSVKAYKVTGKQPFLYCAGLKDKRWKTEKEKADDMAKQIARALTNQIVELEKRRDILARGIVPGVKIEREHELHVLRKKSEGETVEIAIATRRAQEKAAAEHAAARARTVEQLEAIERAGTERVAKETKPEYKTVTTLSRGTVHYRLNKTTGEYEEVFEGVSVEPRRSYSGL